jgi:quercetin dioxygenase-like cupin family protein
MTPPDMRGGPCANQWRALNNGRRRARHAVHASTETRGETHGSKAKRLAAVRQGARRLFHRAVRIDPLFQAPDPARVSGASVTFEPGARTSWHTHPLGQTLIVTSGLGWVQRWGGPVEEIRPGDVIWFPPGEKHWHGATPTTAMTHIAIQEALNGKAVDWMEKVSDEQYQTDQLQPAADVAAATS